MLSEFISSLNWLLNVIPLEILLVAGVSAVCFIAGFSYDLLSSPKKRKKKKRTYTGKGICIRSKKSKEWLQEFRKSKAEYSDEQRFSYARGINYFLWEDVLLSCFEERGYKVVRTKYTRDGGVDGFVFINGENIAIQAKRYSGSISKKHVLEFSSIVDNGVADKGLFIHTGKTSRPISNYIYRSSKLERISGITNILSLLDGEAVCIFKTDLKKINA